MKILPVVKEIKSDLTSSTIRIKKATGNGYSIAKRTANIYNQNIFEKYFNITKCISNKIIKNTNRNDIPYVAGAIGALLPMPFMGLILLGAGYIARYFLNRNNEKV